MTKSGIYKILNKINGKFYIGSALNLKYRWRDHKVFLKNKNHPNIHLQRSSIKHNLENFEFIILEYVEASKLIEREQFWINSLNPEYNILKIAGSLLGFKHSEETKNKYYRGKQQSKEARLKKSVALKKRPKSEEHKAKIAASHRNLKLWPHIDGAKCKCAECKNTRNQVRKTYPSYAWGKSTNV